VDLTAFLLRVAARRPHVLVVAAPGATDVRLAVEAALARRGWPVATGPADTDVLAVVGEPGPELAAVVDAVWEQVPAPRARIEVPAPLDVDERLDAAVQVVSGKEGYGTRIHSRPHGEHGSGAGGDHAGHSGGHHEHHGHGGMVAGLPMAELGADRDGLMLDRLHVPLGPVLPDWPAGLVVRVTLQGDVIQEASAEVLDGGHARPFEWPSATARELDGLARFLGVAGWAATAGRARRLRDAALAGDDVEAGAAALVRRVRRSRTLRWLLRGIPAGATDVAALLAGRLEAIEAALPGASSELRQGGLAATQLGGLLVGAELAAARLIVAAVDPEIDRVEAGHG
jgi:hypothetical protein